jgi:hypothetical protein
VVAGVVAAVDAGVDAGVVVADVSGAVVAAAGAVVVVELPPPLLPLSCGPSTQTMSAVNRTIATPVATAIVTSRRSRLGR